MTEFAKTGISVITTVIVVIVLLYGQLTIDWWQERKKK